MLFRVGAWRRRARPGSLPWGLERLPSLPSLGNATAGDSVYLFINSLVQAGLGVVFWVVAAHLYTLATVGFTSAIVSGSLLISTVANLGLSAVVVRYLPIAGRRGRRLAVVAVAVPGVLALVATLILGLAPFPLSLAAELRRHGAPGLMLPAVLSSATAAMMVQDSVYIARRQSVRVLLRGTIAAVVRFALLAPLVSLGELGLLTGFAAGVACAAVLGMSAWSDYEYPSAGQLPALRALGAYSLSNYLSGLFTQAPQMLYPVLIASEVSHRAAGAFAFAWMPAALLMTLPPAVANVSLAHLVRHPEKAPSYVPQAMKGMVILTGAAAVLAGVAVAVFARVAIPMVATEVQSYLPLLLGGVILFALVRLQSMVFSLYAWLRVLLLQNAAVAGAAILFPLLLLPRYGVLGLEVGWLLSQSVGVIAGQVLQRRQSLEPAAAV